MKRKALIWGCLFLLLFGMAERGEAAQESGTEGHLWRFIRRGTDRQWAWLVGGKREVWRKELGEERYLLFYIEEGTGQKSVVLTRQKGIAEMGLLAEGLVERIQEEGLRIWEEKGAEAGPVGAADTGPANGEQKGKEKNGGK